MTRNRTFTVTSVLALAFLVGGCSSYKSSGGAADAREYLENEAQAAISRFRQSDLGMAGFFDTAYGYAVFPKVTKGAVGIGAAHGEGVVYEQGRVVGYTELTQVTIGVQLGGQTYREIIFFQSEAALNTFKQGNMEFSAQASAVAAREGSSADADFDSGIAVFTLARGGLMFEASIGGQKFNYWPK